MTRFTSSWSTIAVCSPPSHCDELFYDLSPSIIPVTADSPLPDEQRCRLPLRSRSDVEETFTRRKCSLDSEEEKGNDLDTVSMMLCQSSDEDYPQTSGVHADVHYSDADNDIEMTSNDSTGSYTESPPSSSSTASPTSGSFKATNNTQAPCCSRPRIATKAPQAALTLPSLSSTLQRDAISSTDSPTTEESTATTTTPYRFCTSCDTFMGFSPDANLARRKSSILEPIRVPKVAVDVSAPPPPIPPNTHEAFSPQQGFLPGRKPRQIQQQQQQQYRPPGPPSAPMRFRGSQRPGAGSMNPPPLQRKRPLEPPFEGRGGTKSIRMDPHPPTYHHHHQQPPPPPRIQLTAPSPSPYPSSPSRSFHHNQQQHIQQPRRPHPSIPYYNYPNRQHVSPRSRVCACGVPAVGTDAGGGRAWVCGNTGADRGREGRRCGFFVRG